ncbi:flagellar hook-associated protein FlgL [Aestuariibacter halophilus]|uniref:Flagellar hook-associated protein FlgL n=1 Tax=Fluctibacter halophilus TaxID=226011 RepID=A0ABS8G3D2_9ALTE|nr:flagellar hook-associated protein FlgL [Aestuariibacter halophilus]MCC2615092.1 flagellar hook-associated protein FlgL [Aestuariibacter halophilus]
MSSRISTNQLYDRSIQSILDNQKDLSDIQQQLSSGKKLLRPSDDPVGAAQVVRLTEELDLISQYKRNNDLLKNSLEQEEVSLQNITASLNRARVLMVQSGNGVYGDEDKKALAIEISQIRDEVFNLMNTQNANGEYIFAGYQSQSPAFAYNPTNPGNKYTFEGDDGINRIRVSDTQTIQGNSSGKAVFEDVFARLNSSVTGTTGGASASVRVTQQAAFDQFHKANYDAVTPANNDYRITVLAGGTQVQIDNIGTGATVATLGFDSGQPFVYKGMEFTITGNPGDTVDFQLDTPEKKNIAETLNDFVMALQSDTISDFQFQEALSDALVGIDNGMNAVTNANSALGGRYNVAESVYESTLDLEIANKSARSTIQDVDYAEAVSELSKQETALQAAQATFSRVTGLSLFDYI